MSGYEFCGGFHFWWIFPFIMIFFCFIFMRRSFGRRMCFPGYHRGWSESALDILQRRYARGEIDNDEYEERKKQLEGRLE